jgi:hypothetical protein
MTLAKYLTAADIAKANGWTVAYVRNLAAANQWRRLGIRPERYHVSDVMHSLKPR